MQFDDLTEVMQIQSDAYVAEMVESEAIFAARLQSVPDTSWVVEGEQGICGYLVGYRSCAGVVAPWGSEFDHKPGADYLYLHDLAIGKSAIGYGLGPLLVDHALARAKLQQLSGAALVSIQNSKGFWQKLGFSEYADLTSVHQRNLNSYIGPAYYMLQEFV